MFVNEVNDLKIYNLSAGKSLPEWLTDRRKRSHLMRKIDSRRQIELIQDFNMPCVSTSIRMSPDQQYILATGTYKPTMKCFEVCNLSIKFERCFDSEVSTFEVISDDYSKLVFMHWDRYIEIHVPAGRHYRLRIPRFGRDMKYHPASCDLFLVGVGKEIFRLNLERGQFLQPYETQSSCLNACEVSPEHGLLMVGTKEGTVEAWDPRSRTRCAVLDVAIKLANAKIFPSLSAIKFKDGLHMGVGTESGHVLLYDIRSKEPQLIKDHLNRLPVKRLAFNNNCNTVYSMDEAMLKLWDENTGKQLGYIESNTAFNDFCTIPGTGMIFLAQEDVKMLTYYVPAMGPAPKWCSFLDNITEEIESEVVENMYDDYQFVTQKELAELGLEHLIGTDLLKGYMHGYFMDVRLYNKAKAIVDPFAYDRYRKAKIREEIEKERQPRLQITSNLPKVNQDLALKIMEEQAQIKDRKLKADTKRMPNLLEDSRFKAMFENQDFTVDRNAAEYKLLAPVLNRLEKSKLKEIKKRVEVARVLELHEEEAKPHIDSDNDEDLFGLNDVNNEEDISSDGKESSDDDEANNREFAREIKKAYREVRTQEEAYDDSGENDDLSEEEHETKSSNCSIINKKLSKLPLTKEQEAEERNFQMTSHQSVAEVGNKELSIIKASLQERIELAERLNCNVKSTGSSLGNRQCTFEPTKFSSKEMKKRELQLKLHRAERRQVVRSVRSLKLKRTHYK